MALADSEVGSWKPPADRYWVTGMPKTPQPTKTNSATTRMRRGAAMANSAMRCNNLESSRDIVDKLSVLTQCGQRFRSGVLLRAVQRSVPHRPRCGRAALRRRGRVLGGSLGTQTLTWSTRLIVGLLVLAVVAAALTWVVLYGVIRSTSRRRRRDGYSPVDRDPTDR